jgi:hypothetical protein
MATLADLKQRIISETTRDDLNDDLANDLNTVIAGAIDQFAAERWWFNEGRATTACVVGDVMQPLPAGFRELDQLSLVVSGVRSAMRAATVAEVDELYSAPQAGQPTDYAFLGANIYVWPTPNQAYGLIWNLVQDVAPALDFTASPATQSNAWTNSGADLIVAQAKVRLYRDYLSAVETDPRLQLAVAQRDDAWTRLKSETNRRLSSGRVRAGW